MKLKELPVSICTSIRLRLASTDKLLKNKNKLPVIVSLTSIESRLNSLDIVIKSLFAQTDLPQKIILWLHTNLQEKVPARLNSLQNSIFEIRFCDLDCPHNKLIFAVENYPQKVIVVCDDDLMYLPKWLTSLYQDHQQYPRDIIANEVRKIRYDQNGSVLPYKKWLYVTDYGVSGACYMALGYGGVLYPPKCFHSDVLKSELFLDLAPRNDDMWFKVMSYLKGTVTRRAREVPGKPIPIAGTQYISLKSTNVKQDKNRDQWVKLAEHYNVTHF